MDDVDRQPDLSVVVIELPEFPAGIEIEPVQELAGLATEFRRGTHRQTDDARGQIIRFAPTEDVGLQIFEVQPG